ncbi:hypothetical protein WJX72_001347 [[Myrmecia] bisecta]|uniref:Uncharacterized protein n=1 Tax=[Myrmecia] bisecta TaxID=41462 RepID=A0AAW1QQ50_9CHLO
MERQAGKHPTHKGVGGQGEAEDKVRALESRVRELEQTPAAVSANMKNAAGGPAYIHHFCKGGVGRQKAFSHGTAQRR